MADSEYDDWVEDYSDFTDFECHEITEPIIAEMIGKKYSLIPQMIEEHSDKLDKLSFACGDGIGYTPLLTAIALDLPDVVKLLLYNKADPLLPSTGGHSPIYMAYENYRCSGRTDIINHLLDPKLVPVDKRLQMLNTPDAYQYTILHYVAEPCSCPPNTHLELVQTLFNAGARPCRDGASKFPSDLCTDIQVKKLLKQYENDIKQEEGDTESSKFEPDNNKTSANSKDGERMVVAVKVKEQAAQLKIDRIAKEKEREMFNALKEGETTKNIVVKLEPELQKEASLEENLHISSLDPVVVEGGNDKDNGNTHQNVSQANVPKPEIKMEEATDSFKNEVQMDKIVSKQHSAKKPIKFFCMLRCFVQV